MNEVKADSLISREDTKLIKGIAIGLMLMHHLWGFPDRIPGELKYIFTIFEQSSIGYFGAFGKICVSMFFFIGGYGTYLSYRGKEYDIIGRLKKLYISYWKVFVVFIPIAFLFFANQSAYCVDEAIWSRYTLFSWLECLGNFTGMSISYNREWWFLPSYVFALISFPLVRAIAQKHPPRTNIFLVILASILVTNCLPAIGNIETLGILNNNFLYSHIICQAAPYISSFWMGIAVAKDGLLDRLQRALSNNHMLSPLMDIGIWCTVIFLRQSTIGDSIDFIYIPFLIITSLDLLKRLLLVKKMIGAIGKQSTNMWLIHSFLCYYFYSTAKIIAAPRWAILSLILLIALTYGVSMILTQFWSMLYKVCHRIMIVYNEAGKSE